MKTAGNGSFYTNFRHLGAAVLTLFGVSCMALLGAAQAQPLSLNDVPPDLRPWVPWALDSVQEQNCPQIGEAHVCSWPGLLRLDLDDAGGRFTLGVEIDQTTSVQLPGSSTIWPQEVRVGNQRALVFEDAGVPRVTLPVGTHTLEGRFLWKAMPEALKIPGNTGLVTLRLGQQQVVFPKRDPELLWLKASTNAKDTSESLSLDVFRRLEDGVPFRLTTRLVLQVSGKPREIALGRVGLGEGQIVSISSTLPTQLESDSELNVQVFPGKHTITVEAIYPEPPGSLSAEKRPQPWPGSEIWSFQPDPQLRQVDVAGAPAIDPQHTHMPSEWKHLSTYRVATGQTLELSTARRGEPEPPPNSLNLTRELWLDLDGQSFTVRDHISGRMNQGWRLNLVKGELGFATLGGEPQLVTKSPNGLDGVELREGAVDLRAEWRIPAETQAFPAVNWSTDVQQLSTTLNVPPGWQLLTASGVDHLGDTWLSSWDLFTLFFVLIVSLATAKLTHPVWGLLALVTLVLTHDQEHAPYALWLAILAVIALWKLKPSGWMRRFIQGTTWIVAAALAVSIAQFGIEQVRTAIYPQVAQATDTGASFDLSARKWGGMPMDESLSYGRSAEPLSKSAPSAPQEQAQATSKKNVQRLQDPTAVIQTGPGVPDWHWRAWSLDWSGPVHREHTIKLYLLSPTGNTVLCFLRILLCGLLGFLLLRFAYDLARLPSPPPKRTGPPNTPQSATASALLVWLAPCLIFGSVLAAPELAHAFVPSEELLNELRTRLLRQPECSPNCISVDRLELSIGPGDLSLRADINAASLESYQLPGPLENWTPSDVRIDGRPAAGMVLRDDGFLHLRLPPGNHRVELRGPIGSNDLTLLLGTKPHLVQVSAEGWTVDGLSTSGQVEGSLHFHRSVAKETVATEDNGAAGRLLLPPWLRITRTFQFGVDWTVRTEVERLSPTGSPVLLRFPLLKGERVTKADLLVDQQVATLSLDREQTHLVFESVLAAQSVLELKAQTGQRYSERWVVQCGPMWQCQARGLSPVRHQTDGNWQPEFLPWPGEELTLTVQRPQPSAGRSLTIDSAALALTPGVRLLKADLGLAIRNSAQSLLTVSLPAGAEVQDLLVNGQTQPFQKRQDQIAFNLSPGAHQVALRWQQAGGMSSIFRGPEVKLNHQLVNARVTVSIPDERWLLFARGEGWGPAILFWGYLLFILLLAPALGRLPGSPLKTWQWALLALGLAQLPVVVGALIVSWFFAFAHADKWRPKGAFWYNVSQLLLIAGTMVFLGCLFGAVYDGLLSSPDMEVSGQDSSNRQLSWYVDRTDGSLPVPSVLTTSLWVYRLAMLTWALWLAYNLLRWLRWGWLRFSSDGVWKRLPRRVVSPGSGPSPAGIAVAPAQAGGFPTPETSSAVRPPTPLGSATYGPFAYGGRTPTDQTKTAERPGEDLGPMPRQRSEPPPKPQVVVGQQNTPRPAAPVESVGEPDTAPLTPRDPSLAFVQQSGLTERPPAVAAAAEPDAESPAPPQSAEEDPEEGERPTVPLEDLLKDKE